jgi:DNA-binding HxlR family transcriptional regulator
MRTKPKKISAPVGAARMVEDVVGCKWSVGVLRLVRAGVHRPGAMEHALPGLSKKVLNERLRKFVRFGILERQAYAEVPPRVEYRLTALGERFAGLMDGVEALQKEIDAAAQSGTSRGLRGAREASRS